MKMTIIRVILEDTSDEDAIALKKTIDEAVKEVEGARVEMTITETRPRG